MHPKSLLKLGGSLLIIGSLASCGGGGSSSSGQTPVPTPAPTTAATIQSQIGAAFAAIFNAPNTSDPVDPTSASVPALAPASDPIDF
ncbi:MAG: hypothetical protein ABIT04_07105 [Novosphingobium sp.]